MKVILVGYPGSQFLVPAVKYLTDKYLPGFDVQFINNTGTSDEWSKFIREYLMTLDDEFIVFALDDYLLREPMKMDLFDNALTRFTDDVACVKIHRSTLTEHADYPVTTQYTIWHRQSLIELLEKTTNPWDFELHGSKILIDSGKKSLSGPVALEYYTNSSLSSRWKGVRMYGLKQEDAEMVQKLINEHGAGQ